jgi:hypothetical protein
MTVASTARSLQASNGQGGKLRAQAKRSGSAGVEEAEEGAVQKLVLALVILGFVAFVYQGFALSSREADLTPDVAATPVARP